MKSSALVFLAAFVALSASWSGFVLTSQVQLGRGAAPALSANDQIYPVARAGLANQGAEVYRSLGCVYCHSQQASQDRTIAEVMLTEAGTNSAAALAVLAKLNPELVARNGQALLTKLPQTIQPVDSTDAGAPMLKDLETVGAKGEVRVSQTGPDIARWGGRATVAQDFLFDGTVQPGTRRIGPDLANVGLRAPDLNWQLRHLYAPKSVVPNSTMPAYRFLFEKHKIVGKASLDALQLAGEFAPPAGYEILPTEQARVLAAYLTSLRVEVPLPESPYTGAPTGRAASGHQFDREMNGDLKSTTPETEPSSAFSSVPIWLLVLTLLVALWAIVNFDRHGALMDARVYQPYINPEEFARFAPATGGADNRARGKVIFENNCAICHGTDGMGKPGQFPPLAGSEWVNVENPKRVARVPLFGLAGPIEVKGQQWNAAMPTMGALSDKDLAAALSYIRSSWGNKASLVSEEQVAAVRKEVGNHPQPMSADELKKVPEK